MGNIRVGDLYKQESKERKKMARKYKFYRFFGYNPTLWAFKRKCAFCLQDLTDDSVVGVWERSGGRDNISTYTENHRCQTCGQQWRFHRGLSRGTYKFDAENEHMMAALAPYREENKRRIDEMICLSNEKAKGDKSS